MNVVVMPCPIHRLFLKFVLTMLRLAHLLPKYVSANFCILPSNVSRVLNNICDNYWIIRDRTDRRLLLRELQGRKVLGSVEQIHPVRLLAPDFEQQDNECYRIWVFMYHFVRLRSPWKVHISHLLRSLTKCAAQSVLGFSFLNVPPLTCPNLMKGTSMIWCNWRELQQGLLLACHQVVSMWKKTALEWFFAELGYQFRAVYQHCTGSSNLNL